MKELADILRRNQQLLDAGIDAAMATVVRVRGSSYRRPGARMLISGDGQTTGGVSGGCLERDVVLRAGAVMLARQPVLVHYDTTLDFEGTGGFSLGCGGAVDILIEPLRTPAGQLLIESLEESQRNQLVLATVVSRQNLSAALGTRLAIRESGESSGAIGDPGLVQSIISEASAAFDSGMSRFGQLASAMGTVDVFVELLKPPLQLFVFGAGNDAVPLVNFAKALGWRVTVVDVRSSAIDLERKWEVDRHVRCGIGEVRDRLVLDESAAAVVMTHNAMHDLKLIEWLLEKRLKYLGLLGPRHRTEQLLGGFAMRGLRSPVGLDLGADNPEEIALAIVAEITAVMHGRPGVALSSRDGPIHAGTAEFPRVMSKGEKPAREISECQIAGS